MYLRESYFQSPAYGNPPIITQAMIDAIKNDAVGQELGKWKASDKTW